MATRGGKKANETTLSIVESLILAQAVYEVGASPATWPHIAALLSKHPLLHRPKSFFTPQSCHLMYDNLLKDAALPLSVPTTPTVSNLTSSFSTDKNASPHAPVNTQLAQKFYNLRFNELLDRIMQEEANFKTVMNEIRDMRSGARDNQLKAKITGQPEEVSEATEILEPQAKQDTVPESSPKGEVQTTIEDEVFDGSDLSGVSDSTSSPSRPDESENHLPETSSPNKEVTSPPPTPSPNAATVELVTNTPGLNEMDVADDDRAEENELADQLVPDHISPNVSSPAENELADVDLVDRLPETDSLHVPDSPSTSKAEEYNIPVEDGAQTVETETANQQVIVDSVGESHSIKETDDVSEMEGPSEIHLAEPPVEGGQLPDVVHSGDSLVEVYELTPEDNNIQPEQDPKGAGERAQAEERNEAPAEFVNTGPEGSTQSTAQVSDRAEGARVTSEQRPEPQTEELMESSSDKMDIEDEDVEMPIVDDIPVSMQQERSNPSSPEGREEDEVASHPENMPEPTDDASSSTQAHSLELSSRNSPTEKVSMADIRSHSADLEDDKGDRLEPATPLDSVPTEEALPSEEMSVVKDEHSSDEGHSLGPRRSTRRRKSSATSTRPSVPTRGRPRRQSQLALEPGASPAVEVEPELDSGVDDSRPSSAPGEIAVSKHQGKRKASVIDGLDIARERKRARDESEPVEEEEIGSGPSAPRGRPPRQIARTDEQKRFQNVIGMLHSQISQHRNGNIFHNPIKNTEAPDYHDIVKRPMDLKTIKAKVKDGLISNSLEYQRDIYLMFANAMMYNRPESDVHSMAEDMMLESEGYIRTFRQTEGLVRGNRG